MRDQDHHVTAFTRPVSRVQYASCAARVVRDSCLTHPRNAPTANPSHCTIHLRIATRSSVRLLSFALGAEVQLFCCICFLITKIVHSLGQNLRMYHRHVHVRKARRHAILRLLVSTNGKSSNILYEDKSQKWCPTARRPFVNSTGSAMYPRKITKRPDAKYPVPV